MKLAFPPQLITAPITCSLGLRPNVLTDIRRAGIDGDRQWVVSGLKGKADYSEHAIARVTGKGVGVDPVIGDVAEG